MRARNLKPGLFKNELLGTRDPYLTLLFEGLWLLADREGRLEDRPLRIKAEIFPYRESLDINGMLTELVQLDFICRYKVDGCAVIQVKNFRKHQTPHNTEKPSLLPMPSDNSLINNTTRSDTVKPPDSNCELTDAKRPSSLNPSSLNPDSPPPESQAVMRDDFFEKCFSFITERFPMLTPCNSAPIHAWQKAGYDFETQIKPTIESAAAKAVKPKSFNYFTSILEGIADKKVIAAPKPERTLSSEEIERNREFIQRMGIAAYAN